MVCPGVKSAEFSSILESRTGRVSHSCDKPTSLSEIVSLILQLLNLWNDIDFSSCETKMKLLPDVPQIFSQSAASLAEMFTK